MIDSTPTPHRLPASDRRRQLVETALDIFSRKGFGGTTTKEIAAAAGVNEAIIFRHFPTKQDLYNAVLDYHHETAEIAECLAEFKLFMERNDDEGLFRSIIERILQAYRKDLRVHRVLLFAALEGHETGLAHSRALKIPVFELLSQYIARRQAEGGIRPCSPGAVIAAVAGMATHYATMTQMFGYSINSTESEIAGAFVNILMNGIRPDPQTQRAQ